MFKKGKPFQIKLKRWLDEHYDSHIQKRRQIFLSELAKTRGTPLLQGVAFDLVTTLSA